MNPFIDQIEKVTFQLNAAFAHIVTAAQLEEVRITYLSRSGIIASLFASLKDASAEEKRIAGPLLNKLKQDAQTAYDHAAQVLHDKEEQLRAQQHAAFDITAYRRQRQRGSLHPYTHLIRELELIFGSMGYRTVEGPEVETDFYNFTALNIPQHHPARDMHDTFWLNMPHLLLRTHTSTVQIHELQKKQFPLAVFAPGRVYRNEATDASHDFMFYQGEILYVDRAVSMSNILATAQQFLETIFAPTNISIRVRPGYFPFVEPGVEIDASCPFCTSGCSVCKHTRWIELLGAGLVHPNVFRACDINPEEYSGFALGFGLTRIAMIKYGIPDVRLLRSTNFSFLEQF